MSMNALTPPPHTHTHNLISFLAAALVAMMFVAPGWAQTTVTAPGLFGSSACGGGYTQNNPAAFDSSNNGRVATNINVNFKLSNILNWTSLRGILGITSNPVSSITVYGKVKNTRIGADVRTIDFGAVTASQNPSYSDNNATLTERTPYALILYTDFAGHGESNPFAVECFMTGGTYTMNVNPGEGRTSGCFSISPLTPLDVRNCWCGRQNNFPLFSSTSNPTQTSFRAGLGCK
ncbi:MAG: hypothetical protein OXC62_05285 [Aestuariivita sp.]|nr:hypothetical protein [Aestuariivita sp.]